jgi:entericidin B
MLHPQILRIIEMYRKILVAGLAVGVALTASACNTVRGAGKDLNSAADTVQKEVNN